METLEGNKLIAEFHGWKHIPTPKGKGKGYWDFPAWHRVSWDAGSFEYHRSWDWLMPVVEKINALRVPDDGRGDVTYVVTIEPGYCVISAGGEGIICEKQAFGENIPLITLVYETVIDFITYYKPQTNE